MTADTKLLNRPHWVFGAALLIAAGTVRGENPSELSPEMRDFLGLSGSTKPEAHDSSNRTDSAAHQESESDLARGNPDTQGLPSRSQSESSRDASSCSPATQGTANQTVQGKNSSPSQFNGKTWGREVQGIFEAHTRLHHRAHDLLTKQPPVLKSDSAALRDEAVPEAHQQKRGTPSKAGRESSLPPSDTTAVNVP